MWRGGHLATSGDQRLEHHNEKGQTSDQKLDARCQDHSLLHAAMPEDVLVTLELIQTKSAKSYCGKHSSRPKKELRTQVCAHASWHGRIANSESQTELHLGKPPNWSGNFWPPLPPPVSQLRPEGKIQPPRLMSHRLPVRWPPLPPQVSSLQLRPEGKIQPPQDAPVAWAGQLLHAHAQHPRTGSPGSSFPWLLKRILEAYTNLIRTKCLEPKWLRSGQ